MKPDRITERLWDLEPGHPGFKSGSETESPLDLKQVTTPQNICFFICSMRLMILLRPMKIWGERGCLMQKGVCVIYWDKS